MLVTWSTAANINHVGWVVKMNQLETYDSIVSEVKTLLNEARKNVAKQVNSELLITYWNIGRIIVEHEQENKERAEYGKQTIQELSRALT